jgi:DNA polymerase-3 subunit alpha
MQFVEVKQLQDVLETFAKKLVLLLNIKDLQTEFIHKLSQLFNENKGDNSVTFEIMELEKIKRLVEVETPTEFEETEDVVFEHETENEDAETSLNETKIQEVTEVEEIKVVTKLTMPSRRLKVKISTELLQELEKMQVNFKLN